MNVAVTGGGTIRENLQRDRSRCESCKKDLRWWELVPVLSWLFLRGTCVRCDESIPLFHPISEFILGVALALVYVYADGMGGLVWMGIFVIVLYFFSVYDLKFGIVPNRFIFPIISAALMVVVIVATVHSDLGLLVNSLIAAFINFAFFALVNLVSRTGIMPGVPAGKDGFGWGDAKYAILLGIVLGWPAAFLGIWIGVFAGAVLGLTLIIAVPKIRKKKLHALPFVPLLSFGSWVALLWGDAIMELLTSSLVY